MQNLEAIAALRDERAAHYADTLRRMGVIRDIYYGRRQVSLPDTDDGTAPPVPNLLAQGIDQISGRVTSVLPTISVLPHSTTSRRESRRATTAARVLAGWWAADRVPLTLAQRAKHLTGYGLTSTVLRWDHREARPRWEVKDALATLPPLDLHVHEPSPSDCIWTYYRSAGWLREHGYGWQVAAVTGTPDTPDTALCVVLEYVDEVEHSLALDGMDNHGRRVTVALERTEHNLGITPATVSIRAGLDALSGQFDQMVGMYEAQATLMALDIIAVQKGIFPDTYLESNPGETARFIDGPHDGRTGMINIVAGGRINVINAQPGYQTTPTIDRLERNQRVTGGVPAELGGESGTNIRTGRRGDAVLSATIDMPIAYAQNLLATALETENSIAATMACRYDGLTTRTLTKGLGNADRPVTYIAEDVFAANGTPHYDNTVTYPAAGADINQLIVGIGQRVGLGIMSKQTAAALDPYVDNPEVEHDRIIAEGLETSLLAGLQSQASNGAIPPLVLAKIMHLVRSDKMELAEALNKVTEDAMKEQEQAQAQGPPTPEAAMAGPAAAAMTGAAQPPSPIPGLGEGPADLTSMLGSLRMPLMGTRTRLGAQPGGEVAV